MWRKRLIALAHCIVYACSILASTVITPTSAKGFEPTMPTQDEKVAISSAYDDSTLKLWAERLALESILLAIESAQQIQPKLDPNASNLSVNLPGTALFGLEIFGAYKLADYSLNAKGLSIEEKKILSMYKAKTRVRARLARIMKRPANTNLSAELARANLYDILESYNAGMQQLANAERDLKGLASVLNGQFNQAEEGLAARVSQSLDNVYAAADQLASAAFEIELVSPPAQGPGMPAGGASAMTTEEHLEQLIRDIWAQLDRAALNDKLMKSRADLRDHLSGLAQIITEHEKTLLDVRGAFSQSLTKASTKMSQASLDSPIYGLGPFINTRLHFMDVEIEQLAAQRPSAFRRASVAAKLPLRIVAPFLALGLLISAGDSAYHLTVGVSKLEETKTNISNRIKAIDLQLQQLKQI